MPKPDFLKNMASKMADSEAGSPPEAGPPEDGAPEEDGGDGAILAKLQSELGLSPEEAQKAMDICRGSAAPADAGMGDIGEM